MEQPFRLRRGGRVNRHKALRFIHDGRGYSGYEGDTVASALLANGVHLIGRSLKFRRPRGIMGEGVEEPNALARLWLEPRTEPLARLTEAELAQGLRADSVRGFPSPKRDLGSMLRKLLGLAPAVIGAGFVYKTFLTMPWSSTWLWNRLWEPMLRRAAGWGISPEDPDPDAYVHRHETADLVVIGAGPAGLAAARAAVQAGAASGLRVILIERQAETGGTLLGRERTLGGSPAMTVLEGWAEDIAEAPGCRILTRTTAQVLQSTPGDGVLLLAGERLGDHHPTHSWLGPRRRLWHLRAKRVILATGSVERPLVFPDNDRPGIMTAGSVLTYLTRFGAVPGSRAVIFTCCDSAYETATALHGVGVTVEAVIDSRSEPAGPMVEMVRALSIPLFTGHVVTGTSGRKRLEQVECMPLSEDGTSVEPPFRLIDCDLLCVSGGWTPQTQLFSQAGGALGWSKTIAAPVPLQGEDAPPAADGSPRAEGLTCVGAAAGTFDLAEDLTEGHRMGRAMAEALRVSSTEKEGEGEGERDIAPQPPRSSLLLPIPLPDQNEATEITPLWCVPMPPGDALAPFRSFVDFQNDTTLADLQRAIADGLRDPEHVKRYSMAGLGSDQGRFGAVNTLGILSTLLDSPVEDLALTTQRPPYTPVPFGSFAGRFIGQALEPTRRSALDSCTHSHDSLGA
ncbi:MAG: FAD-dependent oxidoreductase, partial [Rhodospirillaceae bacterium]